MNIDRPEPKSGVETSWTLRLGRRTVALGRTGTLAVSRVADQAVLGLVSILLAWRLGVDGFVPISILVILNSFSVSLADFGLSNELLRSKVGLLGFGAINRVRLINTGIAVTGVVAGLALVNEQTILLIGGVLIWGVAGEAFIRKNALIRQGRVGRVAIGEMSGTAVVIIALAVAMVATDWATVIVATGLVGKHVTEALVNRGWQASFEGQGTVWEIWLWLASVVNYSIANVDYLLVGLLVSARAFAIYSLGYRVAALFVSQLSYVVNRVTLVDFGVSHRAKNLNPSYQTWRRQMFKFGLLAALVTAAIAPLLTCFLGSQWDDVLPVILILACAIPWRMCTALGYNALLASGSAKVVTGWEVSRLLLAVILLSAGGAVGLGAFTFAAAVVVIATTNGYDRLAIRAGGSRGQSLLLILTPVPLILAATLAWFM